MEDNLCLKCKKFIIILLEEMAIIFSGAMHSIVLHIYIRLNSSTIIGITQVPKPKVIVYMHGSIILYMIFGLLWVGIHIQERLQYNVM